jgi:gamma-glutamylcysteine synthetase
MQEEIDRLNAKDRTDTEKIMREIMESATKKSPLKIQQEWMEKSTENRPVALRHQSEFHQVQRQSESTAQKA